MSLKGRDFLSMADLEAGELVALLDRAAEFKRALREGRVRPSLQGKLVALIFQKPSTRTRVSFEAAVRHLGGHPINMNATEMQLGRGETISDTGRVLSRYVHAITLRTFAHREVEELAEAAEVPVINALTDLEHPCQVLADLFTIRERFGGFSGIKLTYLGDGNNVANSLALGCALAGMTFTAASPPGYEPDEAILGKARSLAGEGAVRVVQDPREAVSGAHVLYTDVWVSMGQGDEARRHRDLRPYQLNRELLELADPDAVVMHCLPAHRGQEITDEVLDGPCSLVWDQAENRMHAQAALLCLLMGEEV
ncbi:ornithine carbamoyltransferase [Candidatus Solincola tengchongensis]|uniref:ornithine carbamoyltransferase n=1 Tax=Candidatus Solincola tengchongensis TaxID=2900693 RepID=UPI00257CEEC3|nr:ornithine carbamoyltransferase [Candidatus Solincola tengchongensis]